MSDALNLLVSLLMLIVMSVGFGAMFTGVLRRFVADYAETLVVGRTSSAAIGLAGAWMILPVLNRFAAAKDGPQALSLSSIQLSCLIGFLFAGMFVAALTNGGRRTAANYGLLIRPVGRRIWLGAAAYLAAIGPTALLLIFSRGWRTVETQHAYLKALQDSTGLELIGWIVVSAVVAAPIMEELLFRVTLQSWFAERYSGRTAIALTACVFALVHGWRDALPLIPLAVILGGMFHCSRSYLSCVVTHGLFNATFLALALLTSRPSEV